MKRIVFAILLLYSCAAQRAGRSGELTEEKLLANLRSHVTYLADDKLEGRQTGTRGEELAMQYIVQQFNQMGLQPRGTDGFVQQFTIDEGRQVTNNSYLRVNGQALLLTKEFFPLAFSAQGSASGNAAVALREAGAPWFVDVNPWLMENKSNPHFEINNAIVKEAERAAAKKATMLILYNSGKEVDNIQFNKNDKTAAVSIPVLYITRSGQEKYLQDKSAAYDLQLNIEMTHKTRLARNVAGYIDNGAAHTVIIGAHYDHLGDGSDHNSLDATGGIHNGADDNASGTAALIELARMLQRSSARSNNYLFIAFSGEELGLMGSKYWLDHPTITSPANYMINMDMIGRYDTARKLTVGGYGTSPVWSEVLHTANPGLIIKIDSAGSGPSDHASFYRRDIPVLFFFTGSHPDYHKTTDDTEKINFEAQKQIVHYIYNIIERTDARGKLAFLKTREPEMGRSARFTVSLGVIPDYGYSGTGVRIEGVSPGKLGEKIGLQAGDILLQLGEYKFVDVASYMQALSKFKSGDKTRLRIQRGSTEKEFDLQFL